MSPSRAESARATEAAALGVSLFSTSLAAGVSRFIQVPMVGAHQGQRRGASPSRLLIQRAKVAKVAAGAMSRARSARQRSQPVTSRVSKLAGTLAVSRWPPARRQMY